MNKPPHDTALCGNCSNHQKLNGWYSYTSGYTVYYRELGPQIFKSFSILALSVVLIYCAIRVQGHPIYAPVILSLFQSGRSGSHLWLEPSIIQKFPARTKYFTHCVIS